MRGKEPAAFFDCSVYSDQTGSLLAEGAYILGKCTPDTRCEPKASLDSGLDFAYYDGVRIHLRNSYALLPDGLINYPFDDGHGKRIRYKFGVEDGAEHDY